MNKYQVTICCMTYNQEAFITKALDSFLMQKTSFSFKILVHDDASTDKTTEILKIYTLRFPEKIELIIQEENQYSRGIKVFSDIIFPRIDTPYFAICDGDDYWLDPGKLQAQYDVLENDSSISMCFHTATQIFEASEQGSFIRNQFSSKPCYLTNDQIVLGMASFYPTSSSFFRNDDVFRQHFNHLKGVNIQSDYILAIAALSSGKIYYLPSAMAVYRRNANSMTQSYRRNVDYDTLSSIRVNMVNRMISAISSFDLYTNRQYSMLFENAKRRYIFHWMQTNISILPLRFAVHANRSFILSVGLAAKINLLLRYALKATRLRWRV